MRTQPASGPSGSAAPDTASPKTRSKSWPSRGYRYDATTLPTPVGPLARWYFRRTASAAAAETADRRELFGAFGECFRPIKPYVWSTAAGPLVLGVTYLAAYLAFKGIIFGAA